MKKNCTSSARKGSALLLVLLLMALLLMIVLSFTTLVRVEARASEVRLMRFRAMNNAKVGLMIALGELQKLAGPDQAVSAQAAILDTDGATPEVNGVQHPFWTGIWDVSGGTGPTVAKDFTYASSYAEWAKTFRESRQTNAAWLVSGNAGKTPSDPAYVTPLSALTSPVTLYGSPGASDVDGTPVHVSVPEREVLDPAGNVQGSYAYWVGDEGVKAKVALSDPFKDETDERAEFRSLSPPNLALPVFDAFPQADIDVTDSGDLAYLRKMQGRGDLGLVSANADKDVLEKIGHAITAHSQGVVADVRFGGLKKDLSAAFSDDDEFDRLLAFSQNYHNDKSGYTDTVGQIFPAQSDTNATDFNALKDPGGPLWSQLRSHVNLAGSSPFGVRPQTDEQVGISPVVVSAQLYFGLTSNSDPDKANFHLLPAVVLWNPYNVDLVSEGYSLAFGKIGEHTYGMGWWVPGINHMESQFRADKAFYYQGNGPSRVEINIHPGVSPSFPTGSSGAADVFVFTIPNVTIEAGQAVVFSPEEGAHPFKLDEPSSNQLSPGWRSTAGSFYYEVEGVSEFTSESPPFLFRMQDPSRSFALYQGVLPKYESHLALGDATIETLPILQMIRGLNMASPGGFSTEELPADYITNLGTEIDSNYIYGEKIQLLTTENNNPMASPVNPWITVNTELKWLANFNPRALYSGPSKFDVMANRFSGNYDGQAGSTAALSNPSYDVVGAINSNPFFTTATTGGQVGESVNSAVLFEIPSSQQHLQSIGQLMHANLYKVAAPGEEDNIRNLNHRALEQETITPYGRYANLNPAYSIGNSLADPNIRLNASYVDWENWTVASGWRPSPQHFTGFHYDYSYLLNDVLWDSFFLSSRTVSDWTSGGYLPNQRLNLQDDIQTTELFDSAASNVLIDGAFNVNSVSVEAWAAFIGGFLGVDPDSDSDAAFYSRLINPPGGRLDVSSGSPELDPNTYEGYRTLSIDELRSLASAVVEEVKERGPFLSMSDFVNRRLVDEVSDPAEDPVNQLRGALQEAIDRSGLNGELESASLQTDPYLFLKNAPEKLTGSEELNGRKVYEEEKTSRASAATGYLTQADLLARLGSVIQVRSDTFIIRSYGSSQAKVSGAKEAEVWCEAVVQRMPEFVDATEPVETALNDLAQSVNVNFGRRFKLVSFRWLNKNEI